MERLETFSEEPDALAVEQQALRDAIARCQMQIERWQTVTTVADAIALLQEAPPEVADLEVGPANRSGLDAVREVVLAWYRTELADLSTALQQLRA